METFNTLFERMNNGQRFGNPAMSLQAIAQEPEAQSWNRTTASTFSAYSGARVRDGMSHDSALAAAQKLVR